MHYPLVGERVWVSGCHDEFVVVRTDYVTCIATIISARNRSTLKRAPFVLLFALGDFEAAQAGVAARDAVQDVLRSSQLCVHQVKTAMRELRATTASTLAKIKLSQSLIAQSDETLRRWQRLGCHDEGGEAQGG